MSKICVDKNKNKNLPKDELMQLSKEVLADRIIQLEAQALQLKNIITKKNEVLSNSNGKIKNVTDKNKSKREFNFSKCTSRKILLRIAYLGQSYDGLATQEDSNNTIEYFIFAALKKTQLISARENSSYHRCGRTDKGVSASGQVISIQIRSSLSEDEILAGTNLDKELPYCRMLNRLLPNDVRAICWMPIPSKFTEEPFSARFDCKYRVYKYWFPKSFLDIDKMKEGCKYLIGTHDFRNLCKMDVGNGVTKYLRHIHKVEILNSDNEDEKSNENSMYYLMITGNAFLWHQIRCIAAILFLIGSGKENPSIFKELLDVESYPQKPQYNMAIELPLNLFFCSYEELPNDQSENEKMEIEESNIRNKTFANNWYIDKEEIINVIKCFREQWIKSQIECSMIKDIITNDLMVVLSECITEDLEKDELKNKIFSSDFLIQGVKARNYVPLLKRSKCETLENRIKHYIDKKRLKQTNVDE